MQDLAALVRRYVHTHHGAVSQQPTWTINERALSRRLGLVVSGASSFEQNINLKLQLADLWARSPLRVRRQIARYYVIDWGGIKRNSDARLNAFVQAAAKSRVPALAGVASWSKVLTASDPRNHAIFDARVALALNVLQLKAGRRERLHFPALPSQNAVISEAAKALRAYARAAGWTRLPPADVYPTYIEVLQAAAKGLPGPLPLATAEMVLFAHAPRLAKRVPL